MSSLNPKLDEIKNQLTVLYNNKRQIHVSIVEGRKKIKSAVTIITGVYNNFICVTSNVNNYMEHFTITYRDIMINKYVIEELKF